MDWKIETIRERRELDSSGKFTRYKEVRFTVLGQDHSIKVSMPDFDAGKTNDIVRVEAEKVLTAYGIKKK